MADRYLVGMGTVNWGDTSSWSTTSGGGGGSSVPTAADAVFMDSNSPSVLLNAVNRVCLSLNCTGYTGTISSDNAARTLTVSGNVTFSATMNDDGGWTLVINAISTITANSYLFKGTLQYSVNNIAITHSGIVRTNKHVNTGSPLVNGDPIYIYERHIIGGNTQAGSTAVYHYMGVCEIIMTAGGSNRFRNSVVVNCTQLTISATNAENAYMLFLSNLALIHTAGIVIFNCDVWFMGVVFFLDFTPRMPRLVFQELNIQFLSKLTCDAITVQGNYSVLITAGNFECDELLLNGGVSTAYNLSLLSTKTYIINNVFSLNLFGGTMASRGVIASTPSSPATIQLGANCITDFVHGRFTDITVTGKPLPVLRGTLLRTTGIVNYEDYFLEIPQNTPVLASITKQVLRSYAAGKPIEASQELVDGVQMLTNADGAASISIEIKYEYDRDNNRILIYKFTNDNWQLLKSINNGDTIIEEYSSVIPNPQITIPFTHIRNVLRKYLNNNPVQGVIEQLDNASGITDSSGKLIITEQRKLLADFIEEAIIESIYDENLQEWVEYKEFQSGSELTEDYLSVMPDSAIVYAIKDLESSLMQNTIVDHLQDPINAILITQQ